VNKDLDFCCLESETFAVLHGLENVTGKVGSHGYDDVICPCDPGFVKDSESEIERLKRLELVVFHSVRCFCCVTFCAGGCYFDSSIGPFDHSFA
jgi:hypothetical protein